MKKILSVLDLVLLVVVLIGMLLIVLTTSGCTTSVAIAKSNAAIQTSVNATATNDVPFIAGFIADTWAAHETEEANRLFNRALASHLVTATVATTAVILPSPGTPPPSTTVQTVDETIRQALQAKHDTDLKQILVGQQQIKQAVINRFAGNLAAAQALLDGQSKYYQTAGANASTLQTGLDGILQAFQTFAPVISTVLAPAKK